MKSKKTLLWAITGALLLLWAKGAGAGIYLYLEGVPGESAHPSHLNWIEGLSLETEDVPDLGVRIGKALDTASPVLCDLLARGTPVESGTIELTRTVGRQQRFYQIKLHNITLHSLVTVATNTASSRPTEWLRLSCDKTEWTCIQYDPSVPNRALGDAYAWWDRLTLDGGFKSPDRDSDSDGIPDEFDGDADNDGLPNDYEYQSHLLLTVDDALDDADGDGFLNQDEYWAGTLPDDPNSLFRLSRLQIDRFTVSVTWTSINGRVYDLYTAEDLNGPFKRVGDSYTGNDSETTAKFYRDEVGRFFRVTTPAIIP